jgi:hypothetical protein
MTRNRSAKRAIRARMAAVGEPYSVAARALRERAALSNGLPKRFPGAHLREMPIPVPSAGLRRRLPITRDAAVLAAHISGYFIGSFRGRQAARPMAGSGSWLGLHS